MWSMIWPILIVVGANTFLSHLRKVYAGERERLCLACNHLRCGRSASSIVMFYLTGDART